MKTHTWIVEHPGRCPFCFAGTCIFGWVDNVPCTVCEPPVDEQNLAIAALPKTCPLRENQVVVRSK